MATEPAVRRAARARARAQVKAQGARGRDGRLRPAIQLASVALFLGCFLVAAWSPGAGGPPLPAELFFLADPLLTASAALAARQVLWVPFAAAAIVLVATALLGRVFCGYVCPLGACLDWTAPRSSRGGRRAAARSLARWRWVKHALLAVLLAGALAGIPAAYLVDPLALLWRGLALAVYPLALAGSRLGLDAARSLLEPLTATTPLAVSVPVRAFAGALVSAALVALILAANRLAPRLWCRVACPLGALLSLVGSGRWLRRRVDADLCLDCTRCATACPVSGIGARGERSAGAPVGECLACQRCSDVCPVGAVRFELSAPRLPFGRKSGRRPAGSAPAVATVATGSTDAGESPRWGVSRRRFLGAAAGGFGGLLLVDRVAFASALSEPALRPPGARPESELLERCVRCGVCMQACPTNAVQPDLAPTGFTGFFAPVLVMRRGGCDPACTRCGEVCPTGALQELDAGAKRRWVIGTAVVEADRCLRARGEDCRICAETCPYQAVEVVPGAIGAPGAGLRILADRCTGCGLCEFRCPVPSPRGSAFSDRAAVRVVTAAEAARLAPEEPATSPRDESHLPLFLRTS